MILNFKYDHIRSNQLIRRHENLNFWNELKKRAHEMELTHNNRSELKSR